MSTNEATNPYAVHLHAGAQGWEVRIMNQAGVRVWSRACTDEAEARTFASTIQQHIYWLSPTKFRDYYQLADSA